MPLDFKPVVSSAVDEQSGVSIPQPRMLPATLPDGRNGIEYQYVFRLKDERIGALGIFGSEVALEGAGRREWLYTLDLTQDAAFKALFRFKQAIGNTDEDFDFIRDVACGLVNFFAGQKKTPRPSEMWWRPMLRRLGAMALVFQAQCIHFLMARLYWPMFLFLVMKLEARSHTSLYF